MKRRDALSATALIAAVAIVFAAAFNAPGYSTPKYDLHDAGVWISRTVNAAIGRTNTKIMQVDLRLDAGSADIGLHQSNEVVVVHQKLPSGSGLVLVDGKRGSVSDPIALPGDASFDLARPAAGGAVAAVLSGGQLWVTPEERLHDIRLGDGQDATRPTSTVDGATRLAIGTDGVAWVYAPATGEIVGTTVDGGSAGRASVPKRPADRDLRFSVVGSKPVVLDRTTNELLLPGRPPVDLTALGTTPELQESGPSLGGVLIATDTHLVEVPFGSGQPKPLTAKGTGRPAAPVVVGSCAFAAWSGAPVYAKACRGAGIETGGLPGAPSNKPLKFRVNRGRVLLNELEDGAAFLIEGGEARPVDWSQAVTEKLVDDGSQSQSTQQNDQEREEEQKPPDAKDDVYGTRPDRPLVARVLENDTDPNNDVLVVESVTNVTAGASVEIVGGGTQVQVTPAPGRLDAISFDYEAYDGFDGRDMAKVTIEIHGYDRNGKPRLKPQETFVVAGATVTHNVLLDAVDPDGDPVSLVVPIDLDPSKGAATAEPGGLITYTAPGVGFTGDVRVPFVAADDRGEQAPGELVVHVLAPDRANPPKVRGDHASTSVGREVVVDVLANDTDADGDQLRVVGVSNFAGATITVDAHQQVHVTGTAPGVITVDYTVTDGPHVETGPLRVDVIDAATQRPPIAVRDDAVLRPGVAAVVDVLANDVDQNDDVLVVVTVNVAEQSNLIVEVVDHRYLRVQTADGGLLRETTAFTYTISDGSAEATGAVVVRPGPTTSVDQQPRAVDDDVSVRVGNIGAFDVVANDSDPEGGRLAVSLPPEAELGPLAPRVFSQGSILRFVAPDQPGSFRIPYAVTDPAGNRAAAFANVTVLPSGVQNNGPTPPALEARGVAGQPITINVPVATMDPDGDEVTILGLADTPPAHGTISAVGIDRITYVPDRYEGGFYGTDSFAYRVRDDRGAEATGLVRVGVVAPAAVNSRPVAIDDVRAVAPGGTLDIDPLFNDSDPDGDPLALDEDAGLRLPPDVPWKARIEGGRVVFAGEGLVAGAEAAFGYTVTDGVLTDTGIIRVSAAAADNLAPRAVDDRGEAQRPGDAVTLDVLANDSDPDGSVDDLRVAAVEGVAGAAPSSDGRQVRFTMPAGDAQLVYTIEDAGGARARAGARVPLIDADRLRPTATPDAAETRQGSPVTVDVLDNDVVSPNTTKTLLAVEGERNGVCEIRGTSVTFTPAPEFVGTGGCGYVVGDGAGDDPRTLRSLGMLGVTVTRTGNSPPVFREQPIKVVADAKIEVDLHPGATDPDEGDVDKLTFSDIKGTTEVVSASFSGSVLTVAASADAVEGTVVRLTFSVSDGGEGGTVEGAVTVTVSEFTGALAVVVADRVETFQGITTGPIKVLANDQLSATEEPLAIVATSQPAGGALQVTESEITFDPQPGFFGETTFTYTVDDGTNQEKRRVTGTVTVVVIGRPDRPPTPAVTRESKAIVLEWGVPAANGAPITEYRIRASGGPVDGERIRTSSANSFRFDGLTNGAAYTFEIAAINAAVTAALEKGTIAEPEWGPLSPSIVANAIPPVPETPTALFEPAGQAIKVEWNQPAGDGTAVKKFVLQISPPPTAGGAEQTFDATANPMSVVIPNLVNGTPYTFRVRAINDLSGPGSLDGVSELSAESVPETPATRPDPPLKPTIVDKGDGQITVRWQEPPTNGDPIRSYEVEVTRNGTVAGVTKIADPSVRQTTITTDNGPEFTFRVRAENKAGFSDYGPASDKAVSYGVPFGVTDLSADVDAGDIGSQQARLAFSPPRDNGSAISSYQYRFATGGSSSFGAWASLPSNRLLTGLANGTSHVFQVRGCNARGCAADAGNSSNSVIPYGAPSVPPGLTWGHNGTKTITFSWGSSSGNGRNVVGYEVSVNGGGWQGPNNGPQSHQVTVARWGDGASLAVRAVSDAPAESGRKRSGASSATGVTPAPSVTVYKGGAYNPPGCSSGCSRVKITVDRLNATGNVGYRCESRDPGTTSYTQYWPPAGQPAPTVPVDGNGHYDGDTVCAYGYANGGVRVVIDGVSGTRDPWG